MTEPLPKRRRIDSSIHKPFKSPLKTHPTNPTSHATPTTRTPLRQVSHAATSPHSSPSAALATSSQTQQAQLRTLTAQLDTLRQAHRILTTSQGPTLLTLHGKWRAASRLAAEELFAKVHDRVNRMGGVAAWRDQEQARKERVEGWRREDEERAWEEMVDGVAGNSGNSSEGSGSEDDEDGEGAGKGKSDGITKLERRERRDAKRAAREEAKAARKEALEIARFERQQDREGDGYDAQEVEEARKVEREKGLVGKDDDAFTMSMMLRQLGVDLAIIGYDKDEQRWVD